MCLGIPMRIAAVEGLSARCETGERSEQVDLALVGVQPVGTWVLVFLGSAREVLAPEEAALILRALKGLQQAVAGGDVGDAFADLEAREPTLPPHLEAARRAGARMA